MNQKSLSSIVALQQPQGLLRLVLSYEGRVNLLRRKAVQLGGDPRSLIIHYALPTSKRGEAAFAMATVIPIKTETSETGSTHK